MPELRDDFRKKPAEPALGNSSVHSTSEVKDVQGGHEGAYSSYVTELPADERRRDRASNARGWRQFSALLRKDIVMELRTKEMITSMGLYAFLVLLIYYIALSQTGAGFDIARIAAGLLLLMVVFTSMLGLNRSLVHEQDQGQLEALLLSPVDRPIIFFAKATTNLIFLAIVEVIVVPLFMLFFMSGSSAAGNFTAASAGLMALALLVGNIGIAGVGTLLATMSVNTKGRDFILAVLFIPVMFPLLLVLVAALSAVMTADYGFLASYWKMLAAAGGFDVIMLAVAFALYEFILGV